MPKASIQRMRVKKRDGICGKHIEGCGLAFGGPKEFTLGHMVPQSLYRTFEQNRIVDFAKDWNVQPECESCNLSRGGSINCWPLYRCSCHWLQIKRAGPTQRRLYIYESTDGPVKEHLLFQWDSTLRPSDDGMPWMFELDPTLVMGKMPPKGVNLGWSSTDSVGHMLIPIPDRFVPSFNWFESARVGRKPEPMVVATNLSDFSQRTLACSGDTAILHNDGVPFREHLNN